jgi:hypothetical protein
VLQAFYCGMTQGVDFINEHMATAAASMANMTFADCNAGFMAHGKINSKLMPDALHPNAAGTDTAMCYLKQRWACHIGTLAVVCTDMGLHATHDLLLLVCRSKRIGTVLQGRAVGSGIAEAQEAVSHAVETLAQLVLHSALLA